MAIQTALQAPASRSDTSWARLCRTNMSRTSIMTTNARNATQAHIGTVNADSRLAEAAGLSACRGRLGFRLRRQPCLLRQQPCLAEHEASALDGAVARDQ